MTAELTLNQTEQPQADVDAAWASINTPLPVEELLLFISDVPRLFRINPMLEFNTCKRLDENRYAIAGRNISQPTAFDFAFSVRAEPMQNGMTLYYEAGIKSHSVLNVEAATLENGKTGSTLTITDYYQVENSGDPALLNQVDKSLVIWATELQRFIMLWQRWSKIWIWRWYMKKIWQPMRPSGRRITYMLLWISLVEIALIGLGGAIYLVEHS